MARKKKHGGHENLERWLVSYADFITLMFAFFVVMFASSQTNKDKAQQVSDSIQRALKEGQFAAAIAGILGGAPGDKGKGNAMLRGPGGVNKKGTAPEPAGGQQLMAELLPSMQYLSTALRAEIQAGKLQIKLEPRGLIISLTEAAFFPSGKDVISPASYPTIKTIAEAIQKLPNPVRLEGHTDSVPIHNERFRSNWDLSAARSVAMLDLLTREYRIPPAQLAVAGYADNKPLDSNQTEDGRARNRRVDIVILNKLGYETEPSHATHPAAAAAPAPSSQGH
jgi:chemotaxis protein MotB